MFIEKPCHESCINKIWKTNSQPQEIIFLKPCTWCSQRPEEWFITNWVKERGDGVNILDFHFPMISIIHDSCVESIICEFKLNWSRKYIWQNSLICMVVGIGEHPANHNFFFLRQWHLMVCHDGIHHLDNLLFSLLFSIHIIQSFLIFISLWVLWSWLTSATVDVG